MKDFSDKQTADFLEDAKGRGVVDPDQALTDEQLEAGGLAPVRAFVRTRAGKAALRAAKHKEKLAASGVKQVNVMAPESASEPIKEIATRTKAGEPVAQVLADLAGTAPSLPDLDKRVLDRLHQGGIRATLIRWLA